MEPINCNLIEINWEGPFSLEEVRKSNENSIKHDYGLYQIYGTHQLYGTNTLLYIGKTEEQLFSQRFNQHSEWLQKEYDDVRIYLGRFGSEKDNIEDAEWKDEINYAEKLLIYYCSPPYNSSEIFKLNVPDKKIIVVNYGKKVMLPNEVSTLWYYRSGQVRQKEKWKLYSYTPK